MTGQFLQLTMLFDRWSGKRNFEYSPNDRLEDLWTKPATPFMPDAVEGLIALLQITPSFKDHHAVKNLAVGTFLAKPIHRVRDLIKYLSENHVPADPKANGVADAIHDWTDDEIGFSAGTTLRSLWGIMNDPNEYPRDGADALCHCIRDQAVFKDNATAKSLKSSMFSNSIIVVGDLYRNL